MAHVKSKSIEVNGVHYLIGGPNDKLIGGPYATAAEADSKSKEASQILGEAPIEDYQLYLASGSAPAVTNPKIVDRLYDALELGEHRGKKNTWVPNASTPPSTAWGPVQLLVGPAKDMLSNQNVIGKGITPLTTDERDYLVKYIAARGKHKTPPNTTKDKRLYEAVAKKYIDFVWGVSQGNHKNFATLWRWGLFDPKTNQLWPNGINTNLDIETDDPNYWQFFDSFYQRPDTTWTSRLGPISTASAEGDEMAQELQGLLSESRGDFPLTDREIREGGIISDAEKRMADSALEKAVVLMLQQMQGPKNPSSPEAINAALGVADMVGIEPQALMEGYNEFFTELKSTKEFTSPDSLRNYPSYQQMSRPGQDISELAGLRDMGIDKMARIRDRYGQTGVPMTTEEGFNYMAPTSEEEADAVFARFKEFVAPMLQGQNERGDLWRGTKGGISDRERVLLQRLSETEQGAEIMRDGVLTEGGFDILRNLQPGLLAAEPSFQNLLGSTPEPVFQTLSPETEMQSLLGTGQSTDREKELKQAGTTLNINIGPQ